MCMYNLVKMQCRSIVTQLSTVSEYFTRLGWLVDATLTKIFYISASRNQRPTPARVHYSACVRRVIRTLTAAYFS